MQKHLQHGILGYSEFSGFSSQAEACRLGSEAFMGTAKARLPGFLWLRSCDNGKLQQNVLCQMSKEQAGSRCVFDALEDRIPRDKLAVLRDMKPTKGDDNATASEKYAKNAQYVNSHAQQCFPAGATSWCSVHEKQCPVFLEDGLKLALHTLHSGQPMAKKPRRQERTPWWVPSGGVDEFIISGTFNTQAYLSRIV